MARPGFPTRDLSHRLPELAARMARPPLEPGELNEPLILLIDVPTADVSSTAIRDRCARGESIAGLVPDNVRQHIEQHALRAVRLASGERHTSRHRGRQVAWQRLKAPDPRTLPEAARCGDRAPRTRRRPICRAGFAKATGFTDYFLICSGSNPRQIRAIADAVIDTLAVDGAARHHLEGYD